MTSIIFDGRLLARAIRAGGSATGVTSTYDFSAIRIRVADDAREAKVMSANPYSLAVATLRPARGLTRPGTQAVEVSVDGRALRPLARIAESCEHASFAVTEGGVSVAPVGVSGLTAPAARHEAPPAEALQRLLDKPATAGPVSVSKRDLSGALQNVKGGFPRIVIEGDRILLTRGNFDDVVVPVRGGLTAQPWPDPPIIDQGKALRLLAPMRFGAVELSLHAPPSGVSIPARQLGMRQDLGELQLEARLATMVKMEPWSQKSTRSQQCG